METHIYSSYMGIQIHSSPNIHKHVYHFDRPLLSTMVLYDQQEYMHHKFFRDMWKEKCTDCLVCLLRWFYIQLLENNMLNQKL